ncbi:MAG TPA: Uma2 family endonuclease [Bryobacteraceae bacterium]|nr:Uma2 family endonuclease [Bryobacteraceae bacterium]
MITTAVKRLTFEEFEQMPDQPGKQELLDGELIELPPAKSRHNRIARRIYHRLQAIVTELHARNEAPQLGEVCLEMGYRLKSHGWLQPDVSIAHAGQQETDYLLESPALAVEVISNEKIADHIDKKIKLYLDNGAFEVWVLYPNQRHMWIYKSGPIGELHSGSFPSKLLAGQTIDLAEILK